MKNEKVTQTTLIVRSRWRSGLLLILNALAFSSLALSANALKICQEFCSNNDNTVFGANALIGNTSGFNNTAIGDSALFSNTGGYENIAIGVQALYGNTTGRNNTAVGGGALADNSTGYSNTGIGWGALEGNTTGIYNTATGFEALLRNTTGRHNTANGSFALLFNTTGSYNTATGLSALEDNRSGTYNTADGYGALSSNTGARNTATGAFALYRNTSGPFNTADGYGALNRNTTGQLNTAAGYGVLYFNNADNNSAFGAGALFSNSNGSNNSAFGLGALELNSGNNNTALGYGAGANLTVGNNNIDIGNAGVAGEANTTRIGTTGTQTATYVAGIFGATITDGAPVLVGADGHLGTAVSSARSKGEIKPMDKASEAILALKPVTFQYKSDESNRPQFGLIAEEVAEVNPALVLPDREGKPYTVRYDAVNAMLLNEFLKEHRKVQKLEAALEAVNKRLKEQDEKIQKVIARIDPAGISQLGLVASRSNRKTSKQ
jgi:hypothetical protein